MYYVGIDWADQKHDIKILDEHGALIVGNLTIKNNAAGFEQLRSQLRQCSEDPAAFKIGIETPNQLVVDFLLDSGYAVWAMFPGSMKSFRKRYRTSGARDDGFDAFVIADVLRTDTACWRSVDFGSPAVREIRLLAQAHHDATAWQVALSNSLRSTLKEYYPEYIRFFGNVACANALAFLQAYPDFDSARKLSQQQLAAFFKEHHLRNHKTIINIFQLLHQKHLPVPDVLIRVKQLKALLCTKQLMALATDLETYAYRLQQLVTQHPDGQIFLSYPGASYLTAARLLALFGDNRARYVAVSELQGLAGTCPVTEKSGNDFKIIYYRRACNKFYRDVMQHLAFSSLTQASWAKVYYQKHRNRGKSHSHALRCLANVHLRILFAMWQNRTCYDENLFLAQMAKHFIANETQNKKT